MRDRLLLTGVFGPYGVDDEYGEAVGTQMELLNNQITRGQGVHSPRQSYWSFGLYLMAENLSLDTTVLDFPTWEAFVEELNSGGYTHVGISFIVPNVLKAKRMAEHIRAHHPHIKIILGGYGTVIPELEKMVPHDEACRGEGVRWLRKYFGEDPEAPIKHPALIGPAFEYMYGHAGNPSGGILMPGLGCENGCTFCITSHMFEKRYVPLLKTGRDVFEACSHSEKETKATGFSVMDENFLKHPQRARELLREMEQNNRPYVFDLFSSAETIQQLGYDFMVRLGVRMVWIGVESETYAHNKVKGIDTKVLIEELQSRGIVVIASAMLFQEHHDEKTIQKDIDWVIGLDSCLAQFMNYTPFPTTALYEQLKQEGLLNDLPYHRQTGQGELNFNHPNFKNTKDHTRIIKDAFRRKYEAGGPGVLNMAMTALRGYTRARRELKERQEQGLGWNPETLRYEKMDNPPRDRFMVQRVRVMRIIALNFRPALLPALVFAPNTAARRKALQAMKMYKETFGKPKRVDNLRSVALTGAAALAQTAIVLAKMRGQEGTVRQPPTRRTEYKRATS